ncbi:MAG: hypothetical protein GIKADHBN_00780 [Phycisphaerales bacterium]|nr:hypothetical protein [Phycisphaerales bacterium]
MMREQMELRMSEFVSELSRFPGKSIDAFLENKSDGTVLIGRQCIAAKLLPLDYKLMRGALWNANWIKTLCHHLRNRVEDLLNGVFRFVVFNYDMVLEMGLVGLIQDRRPQSVSVDFEKVRRWIVHVYGSLNYDFTRLAQQPALISAYEGSPDEVVRDAMRAANGIKVIRAEGDEFVSAAFVKAREWIAQSQRVAFLGFGFERENMRRLVPEPIAGRMVGHALREVTASRYRIRDEALDRIRGMLGDRCVRFARYDDDCRTLLEQICPEWID